MDFIDALDCLIRSSTLLRSPRSGHFVGIIHGANSKDRMSAVLGPSQVPTEKKTSPTVLGAVYCSTNHIVSSSCGEVDC